MSDFTIFSDAVHKQFNEMALSQLYVVDKLSAAA